MNLARILVLLALCAPAFAQEPEVSVGERPRGEASTFRVKFLPAPGSSRRITESMSERIKLVLPPDAEGNSEERSRLSTTSITSLVTFERPATGGWRQSEVVQVYRRFEEGVAVPDPMENALKGARLVSLLEDTGAFRGVEAPEQFIGALLQRIPEPDRPAVSAALTPDGVAREAKDGFDRKIGRYLAVPLRIGHPSFILEEEELADVGKLPYFLCAIPSAVEQVGGKPCVRVDLIAFSATLKDGELEGVPESLEPEFMEWTEGKDVRFSPPELSVYGGGEVVLELSGTGTVSYRNEENFTLSPARVNRPLGGPIEADELSVRRVVELKVE
jgi:hypothetical protein